MSVGTRMAFAEALHIAQHLSKDLEGVAVRSKVAGSLRRQRQNVGDIEIVVEPRMVAKDLFGAMGPDVAAIRLLAESWGVVVKGGERMIQVMDVLGTPGVKVELYLVHPPSEWGPALAIRTGPAGLGKAAVMKLRERGLRCTDLHIERLDTGERVPCPTEEEFFRLAGLRCVPPKLRDSGAPFEGA